MAAAAADLIAASELFSESIAAANESGVAPGDIIVNVAGSVISEVDLAEALVDTIYLYQRSGKQITLRSTAI
jgi:C-terminal processing protease CtpA/Prc